MVLLVVMVSLLGACAGLNPTVVDKQLRLKQRSEGFIESRAQGDNIAMQQYYRNPGMARGGNIRYRSTKIVQLTITEEGEKAETKLENSIMVMGFTFDNAPQTLKWEWHENDWYLVIAKLPANPFGQSKAKDKKNAEPKK